MVLTEIYRGPPGPVETWVKPCKEVCSIGNLPVLGVAATLVCTRLQGGSEGTKNKIPPCVTCVWCTYTHVSKWLTTYNIIRGHVKYRQNIFEKDELCFTLLAKLEKGFLQSPFNLNLEGCIGDLQVGKL